MLQLQRVSQQGSLQQMLMSLFLIQMTKMMVSLCTLHGCSLAPFCHSAVMSCLPWLESGLKDMTTLLQQSPLCHIAVAASHASACRSQRNLVLIWLCTRFLPNFCYTRAGQYHELQLWLSVLALLAYCDECIMRSCNLQLALS